MYCPKPMTCTMDSTDWEMSVVAERPFTFIVRFEPDTDALRLLMMVSVSECPSHSFRRSPLHCNSINFNGFYANSCL